jgi:hypothetical protein
MALTAGQISTLDALRNGREDDVPVVIQIEKELAEVAKLMVPLSVAHDRTKAYWAQGEDTSIFKSTSDGNRVNGWYCSWTGIEQTAPELAGRMVGTFGVQHLYEYSFGDNTNNSQKQFNTNCSLFLAAFEHYTGIKTLASKRFISVSAQAGIDANTKPAVHFFNAQLRFEICTI